MDVLGGVHGGDADAERVDAQPGRELAHVQRRPAAGHELLRAAGECFERGHDEQRVAARVGRRDGLLEEHHAPLIVDLIIHEPRYGLRRHDALGVVQGARFDPQLLGTGLHVGAELVGPGDPGATDLQLPQRLRGEAAKAAPGHGAGRDARREAGDRPLVAGEGEALREVRRREIAKRCPIVAALQPGRDPVARGRAGLLAARVPEDRVLRLVQRIHGAAEHVLPVIEAAGVHAERERGARVDAAARRDRPVGVGARPDTHQARARNRQPANFGQQL